MALLWRTWILRLLEQTFSIYYSLFPLCTFYNSIPLITPILLFYLFAPASVLSLLFMSSSSLPPLSSCHFFLCTDLSFWLLFALCCFFLCTASCLDLFLHSLYSVDCCFLFAPPHTLPLISLHSISLFAPPSIKQNYYC